MTPAELELRRYAVQGLVAEAGHMALDYFGKQESLGVTMKGAQDWLTVADGCSAKRSASGALGLCHVGNGRTDAYAELHINAWDVAAGIVIAGEAGASINDFFAGGGISNGNPILCCTPALAPQLREITGI